MKEEWKKEMKDGIREIREMLREELRGHIGDLKKEMEGLVKMRLNEREKLWEREREDLKEKVEGLEQEIIKLKSREEGKGKIGEEKGGEMERKLKEMEKWREMKEREERKRNVVVRGVREGIKEVEIKVRELIQELGIEAEMEDLKCVENRTEEKKGTAIVKIKKVKGKKEIMKSRREVKDKEIRIDDDLTWKERKMRWNLEEVARRERKKGKRVRVSYGKIQIEGKW
ncbi:translation machinery-associated protein 22-like [Formica exsecta]|uniref:translation machinery-associated protein 22-like n=1 Tax=Formica exsecta TaxID=72781 RepID=UPI001144D70E|nr:translation machinery-associated protein 22-like [Formica exsecta]